MIVRIQKENKEGGKCKQKAKEKKKTNNYKNTRTEPEWNEKVEGR